jgi:putative ATPase
VAAAEVVDRVGLPECSYALAQAAIYLSLAPKSNAAGTALGAARAHIREHGVQRAPLYLRPDGPGYEYPHALPGHVNTQELMPAGLESTRFYRPDTAEPALTAALEAFRAARGRSE